MEAPVLGPAPGRKYGCAIEILERNPDLEEVSVWFPNPIEATRQLMRVVEIVVKMKKLRRLCIDGFMAPEGALEYLLEMLPGLEELSIELWQPNPDAVLEPDFVAWRIQRMALENTGDRDMTGVTLTAPDTSATTSVTLPGRASSSTVTASTTEPPRQLRRLSLIDIEFSFEYFLKLVQDYPLLESIVLDGSEESAHFRPGGSPSYIPFCEQLGILCPRLDQLSLKSVEINNDGLEYLLSAFPRLKRITIANTPMADCEIFQILLNRSGYSETLEDIDLTQDSTRPSNVETLEMLRRFHKLRRLRVANGTIMVEPLIQLFNGANDEQQQEQQPQPQQHPLVTPNQDNSEDLQSQGQMHVTRTRPGEVLEKFEVMIVGPSRDWAPPELFAEEFDDRYGQQEDDAEDVDKTYPLYNTLTTLLKKKTLLDIDSLVLDYEL